MATTIAAGGLLVKDPVAQKTYEFDWTAYLTDLGSETIATSSMSFTGPDTTLTIDNASIIAGNLKTQCRIGGGTLGQHYMVSNTVVTTASPANTEKRSFVMEIGNR